MALKRFTNGISDVSSSNPWGYFRGLDPTTWRKWYEDWTVYDEAQTDTPEWTLTQTGTTDAIATPGELQLTLTAATNSQGQLQLDHGHFFPCISGKRSIYETRIKIVKASGGTIGQEGFVMGLTSVQTTTNFMDAPPPTARAFDDGWGFLSYDASTAIQCFQGENDVFSVETTASTYADDTYMTLSIYWDGTTSTFYKDDIELVQITSNPPTSVVAPVIYFAAGEAKADLLHCSYVAVALER